MLLKKKSYLAFYIINMLVIYLLIEMPNIEAYEQDVVVNKKFSFANKIMEDFLKSYENLRNVYNSGEIFNSYALSFDIDKPYKALSKNQKLNHRHRYFKKRSTSKYNTLYPVTAIIYESDASLEEMPYAVEKAKSASNEVQHVVIDQNKNLEVERKPEKINVSKFDKKKSESAESEYKEYDMSDEDIEDIALEIPPKKDSALLKPTRNILNDNALKKPEIHSNYRIKYNVFGDKTRFNILKLPHDKISKSNVNVKLKSGNNSRRIQKIVNSEIFSRNNLWHEELTKLIKLIKDKDPFLEGPGSTLINKNGITILILNQNTEESHEQSRNNGLKKSERLNLLRSTYGDACLQIPMKKCKQVIKTVKKIVCKSRFKCKSDFKSAFLENGRIGCEKEFLNKKTEQKIKEQKHKSNEDKNQPMLLRILDGKKDKATVITSNNEKKPKPLLSQKTLRDRYERECQKQSRDKCISACEYATDVTCSTHSCQKGKSKAFKKACKDECKTVFIINKHSDTESTDNDSDSDSESDDDSD